MTLPTIPENLPVRCAGIEVIEADGEGVLARVELLVGPAAKRYLDAGANFALALDTHVLRKALPLALPPDLQIHVNLCPVLGLGELSRCDEYSSAFAELSATRAQAIAVEVHESADEESLDEAALFALSVGAELVLDDIGSPSSHGRQWLLLRSAVQLAALKIDRDYFLSATRTYAAWMQFEETLVELSHLVKLVVVEGVETGFHRGLLRSFAMRREQRIGLQGYLIDKHYPLP